MDDDDQRAAFHSDLVNERFVLQSMAGATISEASSRSSLYLLSLSSGLAALGFVAGADAGRMLGTSYGRLGVLFTMASMVGTVNAVLGGAIAALLMWATGGAALVGGSSAVLVAVAVGVLVAAGLLALALAYQQRRFVVALGPGDAERRMARPGT